jgi:hypothetical protein
MPFVEELVEVLVIDSVGPFHFAVQMWNPRLVGMAETSASRR